MSSVGSNLGVNIDHVATLRQARLEGFPDPVEAARLAEQGGADGIVFHLREDRRHIQDADLPRLKTAITTKLDMEMAATQEMVAIAKRLAPAMVTLVPERREELTTEGGLNVIIYRDAIRIAVAELQSVGILVSLFVDPDEPQLVAARETGATFVELHTGRYANATTSEQRTHELALLTRSAAQAQVLGLRVNAGHGLTGENVGAIAAIPGIEELNIGYSIVARALLIGMQAAVKEMKEAIMKQVIIT